MKNEMVQKINNFGKSGRMIVETLRVIVIVCFAIMAVAEIFLFFVPSDAVKIGFAGQGTVKLDTKFITSEDIRIGGDVGEDGIVKVEWENGGDDKSEGTFVVKADSEKFIKEIRIAGIFILIAVAYTFVMLTFGKKLASAIEACRSPFEESVVKRLRYFVYSIIPIALISFDFELTEGFETGVDTMGILIVMVMFALVKIFEYGAQLQIESDETL